MSERMGIFRMGVLPMDERWTPERIESHFIEPSPWVYFDTVFAVGQQPLPAEVRAFTVPRGSTDGVLGRNKTSLETNMVTSSQSYGFGHTRALILREMAIRFPVCMGRATMEQVADSCFVSFQIAEKIYGEWSLRALGTPSALGQREIALPIAPRYIPPAVPFVVIVSFPEKQVLCAAPAVTPIMLPLMRGIVDQGVC